MAIFWVVSVLLAAPSVALVAYDCSSPQTNITAVSLSSVVPCSSTPTRLRYEDAKVQLLQERGTDLVRVRACLIERSYQITHCGMHSHSSATAQGFVNGEVYPVAEEVCTVAHSTGLLKIGLGHVISGLRVNSSSVHVLVELGDIDASTHSCTGASFEIRGVSYRSAVMTSSYKITLVELMLILDLVAGKVRTPSGFAYEYSAGAAFDADLGHMFWDTSAHTTQCNPSSYLVLYEGPSLIVTDPQGTRTLLVNTSTRAMAVTMAGPTTMCYNLAYRTEHPRLFVVVRAPGSPDFYFVKSQVEAPDVDMFLHMNSKLMYLERHVGAELQSLYRHFHQRVCDLRQQSLRQLASIGFTSPEEFAWLYSSRPGVTAITKGEVIYVISCPVVLVSFRETQSCFLELPVYGPRNETAFLKPRSRILTPFGTETDCSPLAPTMYFMSGNWMTFTPHPGTGAAPNTMTAETNEHWRYTQLPNLLASGIYSREVLAKYQERLMFPVSREAVVHTMAASAVGYQVDSSGLDASRLIKEQGLDRLQASFMARMYGWWWTFSTHMAGVLGVLFIIGLLRVVTGMVLNCRMLHQTFGWSVKLVGFLCGSMTKYLLFQHQRASAGRSMASSSDPEAGYDNLPLVEQAALTAPAPSPTPPTAPQEQETQWTKAYPHLFVPRGSAAARQE